MEEARDFHDWELLHNSEPPLLPPPRSDSHENSKDFVEIEGVSEGSIRSDYFASDSLQRYANTVADHDDSEGSVGSDNPSWIEPCSESRHLDGRHNSSEFWSDSSCDDPGSHKFNNVNGKQDLGIEDCAQREVGFEGIGENGGNEKFTKSWSDSSGEAFVQENLEGEKEVVDGGLGVGEDVLEGAEFVEGGRGEIADQALSIDGEAKISGEGEKGMVWWKVPFEILKFCLFKVNPGWSIAVAAAVMGIVILRRRLYKMKRKSRGVPLKITVEDKKVSQFMKNAARLNEAFSVVRRVPIIRPLLPGPATGLTPWPVMNLR